MPISKELHEDSEDRTQGEKMIKEITKKCFLEFKIQGPINAKKCYVKRSLTKCNLLKPQDFKEKPKRNQENAKSF